MTIKLKISARATLAAWMLLAALALAGCGLKGPLVHPAQAPASAVSSPAPASAASI